MADENVHSQLIRYVDSIMEECSHYDMDYFPVNWSDRPKADCIDNST
jgi:hypothetical protein